ncbi:helix-turn-helix transcriptional regulator [Kribbella sp. NBC_01245]|uniref:AraC family transcriptional regulator n=1 Tax=Kribbella sp. NBC_01245 TaxID=2903578 RepID=UPI002E28D84B|nr:helix-turn-helix transcriptional regulator [Kribbella sp. NBC_01245]
MPEIRQPLLPATTGVTPMRAGGGIDAHWHEHHQIIYAGSGLLAVTTDAGSWIAPATRAIWLPAGTVHEHRAYGETTMHAVALPIEDNPLGLSTPSALVVSSLLRELILAYTDGRYDEPIAGPASPVDQAEAAERDRLRAVLLDQLRHSSQRPTHLPSPRDPRLAAVCAILHEDPASNGTLADLGKGIASERTLSRLCRTDLGMTFPQWRTQLRLHLALRLLAEHHPVTAVAHQCGWSSASAFIDVFRRAFGHTPGTHT